MFFVLLLVFSFLFWLRFGKRTGKGLVNGFYFFQKNKNRLLNPYQCAFMKFQSPLPLFQSSLMKFQSSLALFLSSLMEFQSPLALFLSFLMKFLSPLSLFLSSLMEFLLSLALFLSSLIEFQPLLLRIRLIILRG